MRRGYIALYRKIQDHEFYKEKREFSKYEAWIDILMESQHSKKNKEVVIGMNVYFCGYGESLKSIKTWSLRWGWSESKVRRFFKLLKKMKQIDTKSEGKTTRLSVLNYNGYDPKRRDSDEMPTETRRDADGDATTDKNVNKEKNVNVPLKNGSFFTPQDDYINSLKLTYKNIDVLMELNKLITWNISNPNKQKTPSGIKRHINSWMDSANKQTAPVSKTDISTESWF